MYKGYFEISECMSTIEFYRISETPELYRL